MKRPGKWTVVWLAWLVAFLVLELIAQFSHRPKPRTFSEHLWRWFPRRWRRALLVGLLSLLAWHFWSAPDVVPIGALP